MRVHLYLKRGSKTINHSGSWTFDSNILKLQCLKTIKGWETREENHYDNNVQPSSPDQEIKSMSERGVNRNNRKNKMKDPLKKQKIENVICRIKITV